MNNTKNKSVTLGEYTIGLVVTLSFCISGLIDVYSGSIYRFKRFLIYINEISDGGSNGPEGKSPQDGSDNGSTNAPDQHSLNASALCSHDHYDDYPSGDEE